MQQIHRPAPNRRPARSTGTSTTRVAEPSPSHSESPPPARSFAISLPADLFNAIVTEVTRRVSLQELDGQATSSNRPEFMSIETAAKYLTSRPSVSESSRHVGAFRTTRRASAAECSSAAPTSTNGWPHSVTHPPTTPTRDNTNSATDTPPQLPMTVAPMPASLPRPARPESAVRVPSGHTVEIRGYDNREGGRRVNGPARDTTKRGRDAQRAY